MKIRSTFANTLARGGYARQAFEEYRNWGLIGGDRDDYVGALGAAIGAHEFKSAEAWLNTSLSQWPNDPKLLIMGAKLSIARGDYTLANRYYKAALAQTTPDANPMGLYGAPSDPTNPNQAMAIQNLADLLAPMNPLARGSHGSSATTHNRAAPADDPVARLLAGLSSRNLQLECFLGSSLRPKLRRSWEFASVRITLPNLSDRGTSQFSSGNGQAMSNSNGPAAQVQGSSPQSQNRLTGCFKALINVRRVLNLWFRSSPESIGHAWKFATCLSAEWHPGLCQHSAGDAVGREYTRATASPGRSPTANSAAFKFGPVGAEPEHGFSPGTVIGEQFAAQLSELRRAS